MNRKKAISLETWWRYEAQRFAERPEDPFSARLERRFKREYPLFMLINRCRKRPETKEWRRCKRSNAVEPEIGHLQNAYRRDRSARKKAPVTG